MEKEGKRKVKLWGEKRVWIGERVYEKKVMWYGGRGRGYMGEEVLDEMGEGVGVVGE